MIFSKISAISGITISTILSSSLAAQAAPESPIFPYSVSQVEISFSPLSETSTPETATTSDPSESTAFPLSAPEVDQPAMEPEFSLTALAQAESQSPQPQPVLLAENRSSEPAQFETSAAALLPVTPEQPDTSAKTLAQFPDTPTTPETVPPGQPQPTTPTTPEPTTPGPLEQITPPGFDPVRPTRSGPSYIGIGGNFGILGGDALGDSGFLAYSKLGLTRFLSFRPAVVTDFDDASFLLPVTFDFNFQSTEGAAPLGITNFAPYVGAGAGINTGGDVGPLISGGIDIPINPRLTATAGVNVGFLDPVDLGVFVGIALTFPGLF